MARVNVRASPQAAKKPRQAENSPQRRAKRASAPAPFRLETHVFYLLSRILASRNRALNKSLARHGIDFPRWRVIAVLNEHRGASMLKLAELTSVDRTTLAHTVRMMTGEGLIERRERQEDRRSVALFLTRAGAIAYKRVLPDVLRQNARALEGMKSAEARLLRALLARILGNLEA